MFFGFGLAGWREAQFFYPHPLGEGQREGKGVCRSPLPDALTSLLSQRAMK